MKSRLSISTLIVIGAAMFALGWVLVITSGYGGDSTGGSEIVWRVGGLMLYASIPTLVIAGLLQLVGSIRSARRRRVTRSS